MTNPSKVTVCFDLGGVLVRIRRTWQECLAASGTSSSLRGEERNDLTDFALFDEFQLGTLDPQKYLKELANYLSVSVEDALKVHNGILHEPYEGTHWLVRKLARAGIRTACLSNTNSLHWEILDSHSFSAIRDLHLKVVSHEIKLLKPDTKVFGLFDQRATTSPNEVVYFDDNEGNVSAARLHGWNAHLIDHEADPNEQMRCMLHELGIL
jgi:FMN phosphatase YigB (HAD superfamily)